MSRVSTKPPSNSKTSAKPKVAPVAWAVMRGDDYDACFRKRENAEEWAQDRQHRFRRKLVVVPLYPHPPREKSARGK